MYYICKKKEQSLGATYYGIMDTVDGIVEYYAPRDIIDFVKSGHKIEGVTLNQSTGKFTIKILTPTMFDTVDVIEGVSDSGANGVKPRDSFPITSHDIDSICKELKPVFDSILSSIESKINLSRLEVALIDDTQLGYKVVKIQDSGLCIQISAFLGSVKDSLWYSVEEFMVKCVDVEGQPLIREDRNTIQSTFMLDDAGIEGCIRWLKTLLETEWFTINHAKITKFYNLALKLSSILFSHLTDDDVSRIYKKNNCFHNRPELLGITSDTIDVFWRTVGNSLNMLHINKKTNERYGAKGSVLQKESNIATLTVDIANFLGATYEGRLHLSMNFRTGYYGLYRSKQDDWETSVEPVSALFTDLYKHLTSDSHMLAEGSAQDILDFINIPKLSDLGLDTTVSSMFKDVTKLSDVMFNMLTTREVKKLANRDGIERMISTVGHSGILAVKAHCESEDMSLHYRVNRVRGELSRYGKSYKAGGIMTGNRVVKLSVILAVFGESWMELLYDIEDGKYILRQKLSSYDFDICDKLLDYDYLTLSNRRGTDPWGMLTLATGSIEYIILTINSYKK